MTAMEVSFVMLIRWGFFGLLPKDGSWLLEDPTTEIRGLELPVL